jgi:hypothetical protein
MHDSVLNSPLARAWVGPPGDGRGAAAHRAGLEVAENLLTAPTPRQDP